MALSIPNTFTPETVALSAEVNENFTAVADQAVAKSGDTMTGALTAPGVVVSGVGVAALSVAGGINAGAGIPHDTVCGRLTLTTAVPVTTSDVTAATTLYYALYAGNRISLYNGSLWTLVSIAELSIAVPATTNQMYDVFVDYNSGTPALALVAWTNDTTRATALTTQNGILVLTGTPARRYVGSFRTTGVSGQTEDSAAKRYVWNYYNRLRRGLRRYDATGSWTYTTAAFRQANASAANQVDVVVGVAEALLSLSLTVGITNSGGGVNTDLAFGQDSTTVPETTFGRAGRVASPAAAVQAQVYAQLDINPAVGRHYYAWLEFSAASGTTTWWCNSGVVGNGGISGWIEG